MTTRDPETVRRCMIADIDKFIAHTKAHPDDFCSNSALSIATQFIVGFHRDLAKIAAENNGQFTSKALVETQIAMLRECILDLESCWNFMEQGEAH